MHITRNAVGAQFGAYLRHERSLAELVDWAEEALREGEFAEREFTATRDAVARLELAEVRAPVWRGKTASRCWRPLATGRT